MARWKPNARPREAGPVAAEISASRGLVRKPFPARSRNRATSTNGHPVAIPIIGLATAEMP